MEQKNEKIQLRIQQMQEAFNYLEKLLEQKKNDTEDIKQQALFLEQQIEEDKKMLDILIQTKDPNHSIFSPLTNQNSNKEKEILNEEIKQKKEIISLFNKRIKEKEQEEKACQNIIELLKEIENRRYKEEVTEYEKEITEEEKITEDEKEIAQKEKIAKDEKEVTDNKEEVIKDKEQTIKYKKIKSLQQNNNIQESKIDYSIQKDKIIEKDKIVQKNKNIQVAINIKEDENHTLNIKRNESEQNRSARIKVLETQENERQRIAMDLHDTIVQNLTGMVHKTELCTRLLDMDVLRARVELAAMSESLRVIINELRETIYNLRPMSLNDLGLVATVKRFLDTIQKNYKIQTVLKVEHGEKLVSSVINLTLYRIIQEACNNSIKHAEPTSIHVKIDYRDIDMLVEIQDNGNGFSTEYIMKEEQKDGYGLGLSIMKERTYLLSGDLTIESHTGKGTKIKICIPFDADKEEEHETSKNTDSR